MRSILALLVPLVVLVTGCGGSAADTVTTSGDSSDAPQSFEDIEYTSPIGDFLGFNYSNDDDSQARIIEEQREVGRITAECMRDKGFNYTPPDPNTRVFFGSDDEIPYFSPEWIEKYGFGISTQRFGQSMVGELVGYSDEDFGGPGQEYEDPNQEYVDALSEGEREAYQEALWGPPFEFGPEGPPDDFNFEPTGCEGTAYQQLPGQGNQQEFYETFGDELETLYERVQADPRVVEFNDRISECVAEQGQVWVDQEELYERFESRLNALQPDGFQDGDPFEAAGLNPEEMSEREINDFFQDLNRLGPEEIAQLAEIQAEELELARVVVGCGGGQLNEQVIIGQVQVEYEQKFLDQNASALEAFAAD